MPRASRHNLLTLVGLLQRRIEGERKSERETVRRTFVSTVTLSFAANVRLTSSLISFLLLISLLYTFNSRSLISRREFWRFTSPSSLANRLLNRQTRPAGRFRLKSRHRHTPARARDRTRAREGEFPHPLPYPCVCMRACECVLEHSIVRDTDQGKKRVREREQAGVSAVCSSEITLSLAYSHIHTRTHMPCRHTRARASSRVLTRVGGETGSLCLSTSLSSARMPRCFP